MFSLIAALAHAADPSSRVHHTIPWGTVTAMSTVDVAWPFTGPRHCDVASPPQIDYVAGECKGRASAEASP